MRNRIFMVIVGLGMGASVVAAPSASADHGSHDYGIVNTKKSCVASEYGGNAYKRHYKVKVKSKKPVLTHVKQFSMSPGGKRKETKRVSRSTTLKAAVYYNSESEVGAEGLTKVIAKASAKVNMGLAASGKRTTTKSVKVTDLIVNKTKRNKAYVFFAGKTRVSGTFRYYFCSPHRRADSPTIHYIPGKWQSWGVGGEGAVRCGAGSQTALQKLALKVGCA